jgi:hypothetical protein
MDDTLPSLPFPGGGLRPRARYDGRLEALLADLLHYPPGRELAGVVGDVQEVLLEIDVDGRNARKP